MTTWTLMMRKLLETLWNEPRAPDAPSALSRDWVLVAVLLALIIVESVYRENIIWRPLTVALSVAVVLTLPWRRIHPFAVAVGVFTATGLFHTVALTLGVNWTGLNVNVAVVILPYALLRWGSGREAAIGLVVIAVSLTMAMVAEDHSWGEALGASLFLLFPAALGASVRYQDSAHRRVKEQVRLREREQLARELHDTVAHHVSAIAIQAQAGRALAATRAQAPVEALEIIEEAASRTLTEMRLIVRALRYDELSEDKLGKDRQSNGDLADRAPAATLADIERLALDDACPLQVNVTLEGDLGNLSSMLESTLYRLAQEAVTNAVRHAKGAQSVTIKVTGDPELVRLTIEDDGDIVTEQQSSGLGLRGMAERVALNGGTLQTGPGPLRGWIVAAELPKQGITS